MSQQPGNGANADISSELESFRQQWRAEVQAKTTGAGKPDKGGDSTSTTAAGPSVPHRTPHVPAGTALLSSGRKPLAGLDDDDEFVPPSFDDPATQAKTEGGGEASLHQEQQEPVSALEHYEKAVEKEVAGSLGDSLRLYRKAFRMDSTVDKMYKNKHFPAAGKSLHPVPSVAPATATAIAAAAAATATPAKTPAKPDPRPLPVHELIASFAGLAIEPAPPPIEGMPEPACPLASLPDEILVHILGDLAVLDVGDFVRLARVCKRLAYLVAHEDQIWRRVCVESAFGFAGMHRTWQTTIGGAVMRSELGGELGLDEEDTYRMSDVEVRQRQAAERAAAAQITALLREGPTPAYASWQRMFRARPRIRFNGCYISTVNYIRPGQASVNLVTWNSPVHIVTYFRYLRFFRDGTVISLLTTTEPAEVVHHLTREQLVLHRDGAQGHLPSAVMQSALRGRWRMSGFSKAGEEAVGSESESDVVVETEGVGKYYYRIELTLQTAGKGTRNNKLNWRGFYSYNRLTDDWGEFGLKNDKPFFFSRVRSYGMGE